MNLNNVNVERLERTIEETQADPTKAKKVNRVEGSWNLEEGKPQFSARLGFEGGEILVEADQPTGQGGGGTKPGPMHYCLYGLASCYAATFATMAAMMGITLNELRVTAESDVNFSRVFGLSEEPTIEEVRINILVESDALEEKIREVEDLAAQRCPGVFCLANAIPFRTRLEYHAP